MSIKVYPYKQGSKSAKALAEAIGGKVLKLVGSKFKPRVNDVVVNWGSSNLPDYAPASTLNSPNAVAKASCKLATMEELRKAGVVAPHYYTSLRDAQNAPEGVYPLVCRTKLKGHSGEGIVIAKNKDELVEAPLYTTYIKKKDEYRVHVLGDNAFFIQRKARKLDVENPNWMVRNLAGGFVFVEAEENEVPDAVKQQAIRAVHALGLDFGGVDVIWNENRSEAYVLEVNTACGLEERTADYYKEAILAHI